MAPAARKRPASQDQDKASSDGHSHKRAKQAKSQGRSGKGKDAPEPVLLDGEKEPGESVTKTAATSGLRAGTISTTSSTSISPSHKDLHRSKAASKQDPRSQKAGPDTSIADRSAGSSSARKNVEEGAFLSGETDGWDQDQQQAASASAGVAPGRGAAGGFLGASDSDLAMRLTHLPAATVNRLHSKYDLSNMRIISSSGIESKVTQLVNSLSRIDMLDRSSKPGLVLLHADSKAASKLISVAEIAKREIEKFDKAAPSVGRRSGYWYQYSRVDGVIKEMKNKVDITPVGDGGAAGGRAAGDTGESKDVVMATQHNGAASASGPHAGGSGGERAGPSTAHARASSGAPHAGSLSDYEDDEDEFETMEERSEGGRGGKRVEFEAQSSIPATNKHDQRKVRAVPVLSVFLSRVRVRELEATLG